MKESLFSEYLHSFLLDVVGFQKAVRVEINIQILNVYPHQIFKGILIISLFC